MIMSENNKEEPSSESEDEIEETENGNVDSDESSDEENKSSKEEEDIIENDTGEKPNAIQVKSQIFDCDFHPNRDILSVGEISGRTSLFSFSTEEANKTLLQFKHHKSGCRCLSFSLDGTRLYSVSKDKSICCTDMNTGCLLYTSDAADE